MMPHLSSISDSLASGAATRMSAPRVICIPPPSAAPRIAAMTGTSTSDQMWTAFCASARAEPRRGPSSTAPSSAMRESSVKSSPALKARPRPDRTTALTSAASWSARPASTRSSKTSRVSELSFSARSISTWAMPSATEYSTVECVVWDMGGPFARGGLNYRSVTFLEAYRSSGHRQDQDRDEGDRAHPHDPGPGEVDEEDRRQPSTEARPEIVDGEVDGGRTGRIDSGARGAGGRGRAGVAEEEAGGQQRHAADDRRQRFDERQARTGERDDHADKRDPGARELRGQTTVVRGHD